MPEQHRNEASPRANLHMMGSFMPLPWLGRLVLGVVLRDTCSPAEELLQEQKGSFFLPQGNRSINKTQTVTQRHTPALGCALLTAAHEHH